MRLVRRLSPGGDERTVGIMDALTTVGIIFIGVVFAIVFWKQWRSRGGSSGGSRGGSSGQQSGFFGQSGDSGGHHGGHGGGGGAAAMAVTTAATVVNTAATGRRRQRRRRRRMKPDPSRALLRDVSRPVPQPTGSLVAGPERCWTGQMTRSSGKPARRSAAGLTRTLRTGWWPRFLLVGVLLVVVGAMLLSGAAEAVVAGLGALVIYVIGVWSLSMSPGDYRREPPAYAVRSTWPVEGRGAASPAPEAGQGRSPGPAEPAQQPRQQRRPRWRRHHRGPVRRWRACAVDEQAIGAEVRHMPQRGLVRASRVVDAAH
jgi:hypothetical protein